MSAESSREKMEKTFFPSLALSLGKLCRCTWAGSFSWSTGFFGQKEECERVKNVKGTQKALKNSKTRRKVFAFALAKGLALNGLSLRLQSHGKVSETQTLPNNHHFIRFE
jgi:hypothetical protein